MTVSLSENNIIFTGTSIADALYLRINSGTGQLEYSQDGRGWLQDLDTTANGVQLLELDFNTAMAVNLGSADDNLFVDASLTDALRKAVNNSSPNPLQASLTFMGGPGAADTLSGPASDSTWNITGDGTGNIESVNFIQFFRC